MNSAAKPTSQVDLEVVTLGDVVVLNIRGLLDEKFAGFGNFGTPQSLVLNVAGLTRMTSFGVRQWLKAMDALPKRMAEVFLIGCPTFFVDQLNMVLNFGGGAKILTVMAPYTCTSCGVESGETIDVLAERTNLSNGAVPEKQCSRCGATLEFDESPESYFAFVNKYGATAIEPRTAESLASRGLYRAQDSGIEKPPRTIKIVNDSVTYFRIIGRIGALFRARPLLVGAEGEVVIDLHEVDSYDSAAQHEWRRLLKNLASQVSAVTVVDVRSDFVRAMGDTLTVAKNVVVASILVDYSCADCGEKSREIERLHGASWPLLLADVVCASCGAIARCELPPSVLAQLEKVQRDAPPASLKVIEQRASLLASALNDANAPPTEAAGPSAAADDAILGKYKIVRRLTTGTAVADTFLAKQVGIGGFEKPVLLKKIDRRQLESRKLSVDQLLQEIRTAGRLTHPNIVQLLDVGEVDNAIYLAMEYVNGNSLEDVLSRLDGPMSVPEALHIMREVGNALGHAYASTDITGQHLAVLHGDLGPHNIVVSYDGAVKVMDFGVVMAALKGRTDTQYLAPESAFDGSFDHASDLYSFGVLLYALCSGSMPFPSTGTKTIIKKLRSVKYRQLDNVPPALDNLLERLLASEPSQRPQPAGDVVVELTDIARRHALESSPAAVGALVARLFPVDRTSSTGEAKPAAQAPSDGQPRHSAPQKSQPIRAARVVTAPPPSQPQTRASVPTLPPSPLRPSRMRPTPPRRSRFDTILSIGIFVCVAIAVALGVYMAAM
jgi:serine/threonine protein kinase